MTDTRQWSRRAGYASVVGGLLVVGLTISWALRSSGLTLRTGITILGAAGMTLNGIFWIRNPAPPASDRERAVEVIKNGLILGLINGGIYVPELF
ncbi:hypothetical protein ACFQJ7_17200 [Halovenus rubra]|uniref:Uncharacterized protein n=2 Tax=Halovenus rubra TaxID=869890 RepID=A0ABD5XEW1_9EURY|nr:hypothetical protein [Halovenus rubra]